MPRTMHALIARPHAALTAALRAVPGIAVPATGDKGGLRPAHGASEGIRARTGGAPARRPRRAALAAGLPALLLLGAFVASALAADPTTTTSVSSTPSSGPYGTTVTFTFSTSGAGGTPTGWVDLYDGGTILTSCSYTGSPCIWSTATLGIGTHSITARYRGNGTFDPSTSAPILQTVTMAYRSSASGATSSNTPTSLAIPVPAGIAAGDALVAAVGVNGSATITTPAGWTKLGGDTTQTGYRQSIYWRSATGSETGSFSFAITGSVTATRAAGVVVAINGASTTAPVSAEYAGLANSLSATAIYTPGLSLPAARSGMALIFGGLPTGTSVVANGVLSPYTLATQAVSTQGGSASQVTIAGAYGTAGSAAIIPSSQITMGTAALNVGHTVYVVQRPSVTSTTIASSMASTSFGQALTLTGSVTPATATGTITFLDGGSTIGSCGISNGSCTLQTSALPAGTRTLSARYEGDGENLSSTSPSISQVVLKATPSVTASTSQASSIFGQSVTLTGSVVPTGATGTITFVENGTSIASCPIVAGTGACSASRSTLSAGSHSIVASYGGDANYAAVDSSAIIQVVAPATTTTSVTSSANPAAWGGTIRYTVTLANTDTPASIPLGTVAVSDGSLALGTCTLSPSGTCDVTTSLLLSGAHSITARYYPQSGNWSASTSNALAQTVTATSSASVSVSPASPKYGAAITFTLSATAADGTTPTGTISLSEGTTPLGGCTLSGGSCTVSRSDLSATTHPLTVRYGGDTYRTASTGSGSVTVAQATTMTLLSTSSASVAYGTAARFSVSVMNNDSGAVATGSVTLTAGATQIGTCTLATGACDITAGSSLASGTYAVVATYAGTTNFAGSASGPLSFTVSAGTTTSFGSSPTTSVYGATVTFAVRATAADGTTPTGTITVTDNGNAFGACDLTSGGACTFAKTGLTVGAHPLSARYGGDAAHAASTATMTHTVGQARTTTTVATSQASAPYGTTLRYTVTVANPDTSAVATGTVTVTDGTTVLGTCTLGVAGTCEVTANTLTASATGTARPIGAVYAATTNFLGSAGSVSQTVTRAGTSLSVSRTPSTPAVVYGTSVTYAVRVSAANATPAGTVTFSDAATSPATVLGSCDLTSGGACTFTTNRIVVGTTRSITASYAATTNFTASSATNDIAVLKLTPTLSLSSSANPAPAGRSVSFTASLGTGGETGTVFFTAAPASDPGLTTNLPSCTLSSGRCSVSATLAAETQIITASYSGDANNDPASTWIYQYYKPAADITLTPTPSSSTFGDPVAFAASVVTADGITAVGTITIADGSTPLGTCPLDGSGACTVTTSALTGGTRSVTAAFTPDAGDGHAPGVSSAVSFSVAKATPTPVVTSSNLSTAAYGSTVTYTVTLTGVAGAARPGGTVSVSDGAIAIGTCTLTTGTCTVTSSTLSGGIHSISARYNGDGNYAAATSAAIGQTIVPGSSTTTLTAATSLTYGQQLTISVGVTKSAGSATPSGTATILDNGVSIGTCPLTAAACTFATNALGAGSHPLTATYSGDANYATSTSATVTVTVAKAPSTATLSSTATTTVFGTSITFTAQVDSTAGIVTGSVNFLDNGVAIGTCTLGATGGCTFAKSDLSAGSHPISVQYPTTANFLASSSATATVTVQKATTTTTLTSARTTSAFGSGTVTVTVAPATASGVVALSDGSAPFGSCTLVSGTCTISIAALSMGTHTLVASYPGDLNHGASTSSTVTQNVVAGVKSSSSAGTSGTTATSLAIPAPASLAAGDVLVASITYGTATPTVNVPAGWTQLGSTISNVNISQALFWKVAGAGDVGGTLTFTFGATKAAGTVVAASGASAVLPGPAFYSLLANSLAAPQIYTRTLDLGGFATGIPVLFGGIAASTSISSVAAGYTAGSSAAAAGGGTGAVVVTSASASGALGRANVVNTAQINMAASGVNIGGAVYILQKASVTTTTAATPSIASSVYGQSVRFSVTVSAATGTPEGSVDLLDVTSGGSVKVGSCTPISGSCDITTSALSVGTHSLTVAYNGDGVNAPSSASLSFTVSASPTTTTVTSANLNASPYGRPLQLTVAVTSADGGVPAGLANVYDSGVNIGSCTLSSGTCIVTAGVLSVGQHALTATYGGSGNFASSISSPIVQTIVQTTPAVTVTSASPSVTYGTRVGFTISLSTSDGTVPTGTVTLLDGTTGVATCTLDLLARCDATTGALTVGTHTMRAAYAGDLNHAAVTGGNALQTITAAATSTAITPSIVTSPFGSPIVFSIVVTAPGGTIPTGSVLVADGTAGIGNCTLVGGRCDFTYAALSGGAHTILAGFPGDANHAASTGQTAVTISASATSTVVTSSLPSSTWGQSVTFTVAVTSGDGVAATGTVSLSDGSLPLGTCLLVASRCDYTTATLSAGSHSIVARFPGDANHSGSVSAAIAQLVAQAPTSTSLSLVTLAPAYGQPITFTVAVSTGDGFPAVGSVALSDGTTGLAVCTLANGRCDLTTSTLAAGLRSVTARFAGTANVAASTSPLLAVTVAPAATTVTVRSSGSPSLAGSGTLTASVVPSVAGGGAAPSGSVAFLDGTVQFATCSITTGGSCSVPLSSLAIGTHAITATYAGDGNYLTGSASLSQNVVAGIRGSVSAGAGSATVLTLGPIAAVLPGDLLVASVTAYNGNGVGVSAPAGWSLLGELTTGTGSFYRQGIFWKVATSGDAVTGATWTVGLSGGKTGNAAGTLVAVAGGAAQAPAYAGAATTGATIATPAVTTNTTRNGIPLLFASILTNTAPSAAGAGYAYLGQGSGWQISGASGQNNVTAAFAYGATQQVATTLPASSITMAGGAGVAAVGQAVFVAQNAVATATTVTATPASSVYGNRVTFTILVAAGDGSAVNGTVSLSDGTAGIGSCAIAAGRCDISTATLTAGTHAIVARYPGFGSLQPSQSATLPYVVAKASTTASVTQTTLSPAFGASVSYTVLVRSAAGAPSGSVALSDGTTGIGGCTLAALDATGASCVVTTSALAAGPHAIVAAYTGAADYSSATSAPLASAIGQAPVTLTVSSSSLTSPYGRGVTFTATAAGANGTLPGGTISFSDGTAFLASCTLVSGSCSTVRADLTAGTHQVSARYDGDANHQPATATPVAQAIDRAVTTATIATNPAAPVFGQPVTVTLTLAAADATIPTGSVALFDGTTGIGSCTLAAGRCDVTSATLAAGAHSLLATYAGDANHGGTTSASTPLSVAQVATTIASVAAPTSSAYGQAVSLTISVAGTYGTIPSGTVGVSDAGVLVGSCALGATGSCAISTSSLLAGSRSLAISYLGDGNHLGSSTTRAYTVAQAATTTTVVSSAPSSSYLGSVTFTVSVIGATGTIPTGTIALSDGTAPLGTCTLAAGGCTVVRADLSAGAHAITARFLGDANHAGSVSPAIVQSVAPALSTVTVTSTGASSYGATVTFTVTVNPSAAAGTVDLYDGGVLLGTCTLVSGSCTVLRSDLTAGTHQVTATFAGGANYAGSTSPAYGQVVAPAATLVTIVSSAPNSTYGSLVTFTATIAPAAATGSVAFFDGTTGIGSCTALTGSCAIATGGLLSGSHQITAVYAGTPNYQGSTSASIPQTVTSGTTTSIATSVPASAYGDPVTFTVSVSSVDASLPTGTITLSDGTTAIGSCTLAGGRCDVTTASFAAGIRTVVATYGGDANRAGSSATRAFTVAQAITTTTVVSSVPSSTYLGAVVFTVNVTGAAGTLPSGTVALSDGTTGIGTCLLVSGTCPIVRADLTAGVHAISARYLGDANHAVSVSPAIAQSVAPAATTVAVSSAAPSAYGTSATFTVNVSPAAATGTVAVSDGTTPLGLCVLVSGACVVSRSDLTAGTHQIVATYAGGANYAAATSLPFAHLVTPATTSATLASSATTTTYGSSVTFTVTLTPATASGIVTILDGSTPIGTCTPAGGTCVVATSALLSGVHTVRAVYGGDANHAGVTSAAVTQNVVAGTTTTLTPNPTSSAYGDAVTYTIAVTSADPTIATGTVALSDGTIPLGTCALSDGTCSIVRSDLTAGVHAALTARYLGDPTHATSVATRAYTVAQATTTTTVVSSTSSSIYLGAVTFTVSVAGAAGTVPGGTIALSDGTTPIGNCTLVAGACTVVRSDLSSGVHAISARYLGDANHAGSTSAAIAQQVVTGTRTVVTSSSLTSVFGATVTFSSVVSASDGTIPAGSVTVLDGSTTLGSCTLVAGRCDVTANTLVSGAHAITARYGGASYHAVSSAAPIVQSVLAGTTTSVASSALSSTYGQTLTFTVAVTALDGTTPAGTVGLFDGATQLTTCTLTSGGCSFARSDLASGTRQISARYLGTTYLSSSTSSSIGVTVAKATTSTTVASSGTVKYGQVATFTVTVASGSGSTPTGTVAVSDGTTPIGSCTLVAGRCDVTSGTLSIGSRSVSATYAGDGNHGASAAAPVVQQVDLGATTTTISTTTPNVVYGSSVTFRATVSPSTATGTVTLGKTAVGNGPGGTDVCTLVAGTCTITVSALELGTYAITGTYSGDATWATSTSAPVISTISMAIRGAAGTGLASAATSIALTMPAATTTGDLLLATVTVGGGTGTTITPPAGWRRIGDLSNATTQRQSIYAKTATATDPGASQTFAFSSSQKASAAVVAVAGALTTTDPLVASALDAVADTTLVTPALALGTTRSGLALLVGSAYGNTTFSGAATGYALQTSAIGTGSSNGTNQGSGIASGAPTIGTSIAASSITLSANASGIGSTIFIPQFAPAQTSTTIVSSANPSSQGSPVTFTVRVESSAATGTVTVSDGTTTLGSCALVAGRCDLTAGSLASGSHPIVATYGGDANFAASTSAVLTQIVRAYTATSVTATPASAEYGAPVTLTASVVSADGVAAAGTISFSDGSLALGSCSTTTGTCSIAVSTLTVGDHAAITAAFAGSAAHAPSSGTAPLVRILPAATTTTIATSAASSPLGAAVTYTITVISAGGTPTGTVTVSDGTTALGSCSLIGGSCAVTTRLVAFGSRTIVASYPGDASRAASGGSVAQAITPAVTTLALSSSTASTTYGQALVLTVSLTSGDGALLGGTIAFSDGTAPLGTCTLAAGGCSFTTSALTAGAHTIAARYAGDATHLAAAASLAQSVAKATTFVSIATTPAPSVAGQAMTITVSLSPTTPTGVVAISDGTTPLGTCTLVGGTCDLATSALAVGTHAILASYGGDANHLADTETVSHVVNAAPTTTELVSSPNPSALGQAVTIAVTVRNSGSTAGGTVAVSDGTTPLGSCTLSGGTCSIVRTTLTLGSHTLVATYGGDAIHSGSSSVPVSHVVVASPTSTTITASPTSSTYLQPVRFTATVAPASATGTVAFLDGSGGTYLNSCTLAAGTCSAFVSALSVGRHGVVAVYQGDTLNGTSSSGALTFDVAKAATTTSVTSNAALPVFGTRVTFTIVVTAANGSVPTGTVALSDGTSPLGTCTLVSGRCDVSTGSLPSGTRTIVATYLGDGNHVTSVGNLTQQVAKSTATVTLAAAASIAYGTGTSVTVTVAPSNATGTIALSDGTTSLGSCTLAGGTCTIPASGFGIGSRTIVASYSGDANYEAATASRAIEVTRTSSTTRIGTIASPTVFGTTVTIPVSVSTGDGGTAAGTVSVTVDGAPAGSCTLAAAACEVSAAGLAVGSHLAVATYGGDTFRAGSLSSSASFTVVRAPSATSLTLGVTEAAYGSVVTFGASVTPATAGGTITFLDGSTVLGTCTLSGGSCSLSLSGGLAVGTHAIGASYAGDASYLASATAATQTLTIVRAVSALTVVNGSGGTSNAGAPVTLAISLAPSEASGTVTVSSGGFTLTSCTLSGGACSVTLTGLAVGTTALRVTYAGDLRFLPAIADLSQTVRALEVYTVPATSGDTVSRTATALPGTPSIAFPAGSDGTFTVTFATTANQATPISTPFAVSGTMAIVDISASAGDGRTLVGPFTICLAGGPSDRLWHYTGGAWVDVTTTHPAGLVCGETDSLSPFVAAPVKPTPGATLSPLSLSITTGTTASYTVTVTGGSGTATGTVAWTVIEVSTGQTVDSGSCTLASGSCPFSTDRVPGVYSVRARYGGDGAYGPATTAIGSLTVNARSSGGGGDGSSGTGGGDGSGGTGVTPQPQTLEATAATTLVYGSTTRIAARASSGLAPVFSSLTPGICSVDTSTGAVKAIGAGTCQVSIAQPGDGSSWLAATSLTRSIAVGKATIRFTTRAYLGTTLLPNPARVAYNKVVTIRASSSSLMAGKSVWVYRRIGTGSWSRLISVKADVYGKVLYRYTVTRADVSFRFVWLGNPNMTAATGTTIRVYRK